MINQDEGQECWKQQQYCSLSHQEEREACNRMLIQAEGLKVFFCLLLTLFRYEVKYQC